MDQEVERDTSAVDANGTVVREKTKSVRTSTSPKITISNIIWYIFGFIAILLSIRFILKLAGANANNSFVDLVYSVSGVMSSPFDTILGVTKSSSGTVNSVFEPSILVAIAIYALIAWGISKLLTLNEPHDIA